MFIGEPYYPTRFSGSKRSLTERCDSFQYVPILNTLKRLLNDTSVLEYVEHPHQRSDDLLEDFCDGELVSASTGPRVMSRASAPELLSVCILFFGCHYYLCVPLGGPLVCSSSKLAW